MGAGSKALITDPLDSREIARVIDGRLLVTTQTGGGGGITADVNIEAVGGVAIGTSVPINDAGGSLTVDGTVAATQSGAWTVTVVEPVSVDDNGGSLTVDGTVAVSSVAGTVTVAGTVAVSSVAGTVVVGDGGGSLSIDDGGGSITIDGTVTATIAEPVEVDTSFLVDSVAGATAPVFPAGAIRDDVLTTLTPADGDYVNLRTNSDGALWVTAMGTITIAEPVSVDDNGGSLTIDGTVAVSSVAGTVVVGDGGGSLTVDGTVAVSSVAGTVVVGDGGGSLTVDGTVAVSSVGGTVTVAGTVAVTQPVAVTDNGGSLTVDGTVAVSSVAGTVAVTQSGAWTVAVTQPVAVTDNGGSLTVDGTVAVSSVAGTVTVGDGGGSLTVDDGGGSLTVDGTVAVSGTVTVTTGFLRDSVAGATDAVFPAGAVRKDTLADLTPADGDYVGLRTDIQGALWVRNKGDAVAVVILSGSTDGAPIIISGTAAGSSNTIHTAHATATDRISLYGCNAGGFGVMKLTLYTVDGSTNSECKYIIMPEQTVYLGIFTLTNSEVLKAYASTTNVMKIFGEALRHTA